MTRRLSGKFGDKDFAVEMPPRDEAAIEARETARIEKIGTRLEQAMADLLHRLEVIRELRDIGAGADAQQQVYDAATRKAIAEARKAEAEAERAEVELQRYKERPARIAELTAKWDAQRAEMQARHDAQMTAIRGQRQ